MASRCCFARALDRKTAAFNASVAETRYADTTPWRQFGRDRRADLRSRGIQLAY